MRPLVILSGPTAVGKTDLSIKLAKRVNGEIISADSMQVYKRMDIGTAKVTKEEMDGVNHYLIDIIEPTEEWNILKFKTESVKAIEEIYSRGHIPIIAGGTGFYIQSVIKDVDFSDEPDNSVRDRLTSELNTVGAHALHERLKCIDPISAEIIHENNTKRVIRALEFYEINGYPISKHNSEQNEKESIYNYAYFVLNNKREIVYDRIDRRVDLMVKNGLIEEVKSLMDEGLDMSYISMQGLGYKEIYSYLKGEITLEDAIYILKRDTRHFAKRQLTWFRREKDTLFFDKSEYESDDAILDAMLVELKKKGIISE